jgi:hypothetical protein
MDYDEVQDERNTATNSMLYPGTMYIYYVRTVVLRPDPNNPSKPESQLTPIAYSTWVAESVTTPPVRRPEDLKRIWEGNYNVFTEALISFAAPAHRTEVVPGGYDIEFSFRPEDGEWSTPASIRTAIRGGETPSPLFPGYFVHEYTLRNLEHGKVYLFRLRMVDADGARSAWSEILTIETEIDPNVPPDESEKWADYFKRKMEEVLKRPYWPLRMDGGTVLEAAYRGSMINGVIGGAAENMIELAGTDRGTQVYYIPAASVQRTDASNNGFKIVADNVTLIIPPNLLDPQSSNALKEITKQLNDRSIRDYYLQISVTLTPTREPVNGNPAVTDRITLSVKTVGFTEIERLWDAQRADALTKLYTSAETLGNAERRIRAELDRGATDLDMVRFVERLANELERDFIAQTRNSFNDRRLYEYEAAEFANPVRIIGSPREPAIPGTAAATTISGFMWFMSGWQSQQSTPYGNGFSMQVRRPGEFIFSGITINIPGISGMANADGITALIIKYGLTDYFMSNDVINLSAALTNDALTGTVARLAGASSTQDAVQYLRDKGARVTVRNLFDNAVNENVIYLIMTLYEMRTNTPVSSIRVTNFNVLRGINGISATFVPHYRAAYQLGFLSKQYQPKQHMTIRDFFEILGVLNNKVGL